MILYVDETKESKEAVQIIQTKFPGSVIAPSSGAGLPEFVYAGASYIGIRLIKELVEKLIFCKECQRASNNSKTWRRAHGHCSNNGNPSCLKHCETNHSYQ